MYWLNVYDIPEGVRTGKGRALVNLLPKIEQGEMIRAMLTVRKEMFDDEKYSIVMITKNGIIKKTALAEFKNLRKVGIRALNIEEEDDLVEAAVTDGTDEIIIATARGMACRFNENQVRCMGRAARGVTGIKFKIDGDCVVSMEAVPAESGEITAAETADVPETGAAETEADEAEETTEAENGEEAEIPEDDTKPQVLVITSGGMGKRSYVEGYRLTNRGARGVRNVDLAEDETVVATIRVEHGDEILLTTKRGQITRISVDEIRLVGRNSKGVRIMDLRKDDAIIGASRIVQVEETSAAESDIPTEFFASAGTGNDPLIRSGSEDDDDQEEYYDAESEETEKTDSESEDGLE